MFHHPNGDERCDIPLGTCSWCWAAAGSGVPLQSLLQAGLQKRRVCNDSRSCDEQTIHIVSGFLFISASQMLSSREDAVPICCLVGGFVGLGFVPLVCTEVVVKDSVPYVLET